MIWALLAVYLFGASGEQGLINAFARTRTFITENVRNAERRAELQAAVDAAAKATKDEARTRGRIVRELADVSARHDAGSADIQAVLERYRRETSAYQERMINYRFYLKAKMTREEWSRMFPTEGAAPAP